MLPIREGEQTKGFECKIIIFEDNKKKRVIYARKHVLAFLKELLNKKKELTP